MAQDPGTYNDEIVQEFYASYVATLRGSISKRSKPLAQDPLTSTLVQGCSVDISPATIRHFLYGPTTGHFWYIAADGEHAEWVAAPRLGIRKATLNFVVKFFWLLVHNRVSPTKANKQVTWDRAVMVAALTQGGDLSIPDHTDTIPTSLSQADSMAPSSFRSTQQLGATIVPLARVQKLEAQMAKLLHHIQSWMQKLIAKSEARMERKMEGMMDRKIQAVNKRLDAFEL
ncbi:hypothetical protein H5410_020838 [Solanum commersonii]|uniref:Putative plant transposon protein domain-containing protein n=1 Tax=Solanum commersonii TaxID=4109 RepID=A0A9J5ZB17_SOLCO|nr:hypothetical protein H5410_020838 [Solanum commersonii]